MGINLGPPPPPPYQEPPPLKTFRPTHADLIGVALAIALVVVTIAWLAAPLATRTPKPAPTPAAPGYVTVDESSTVRLNLRYPDAGTSTGLVYFPDGGIITGFVSRGRYAPDASTAPSVGGTGVTVEVDPLDDGIGSPASCARMRRWFDPASLEAAGCSR